jgi:hypothetical protein
MCRGLVGPPGCRGHAQPDEWEIHRESGGHRAGLRPHGTERIPDPARRGANGTIDAAPQALAATIGADGRRLLQAVETATDVPWLRCWVRPILRRIGRISHPFVSVSARLWQTLRFGQCCVVPVYQTGPRPILVANAWEHLQPTGAFCYDRASRWPAYGGEVSGGEGPCRGIPQSCRPCLKRPGVSASRLPPWPRVQAHP